MIATARLNKRTMSPQTRKHAAGQLRKLRAARPNLARRIQRNTGRAVAATSLKGGLPTSGTKRTMSQEILRYVKSGLKRKR